MPYNSDITDIRTLAGIGTSTQDFADARIIELQESAKDVIDAKTGRSDWSTADASWDLIKEIENLLTAAFIVGHGGPTSKDESERLWLRGMQLLEIVVSTQVGAAGADAELIFSSSKYLSYFAGLADDPNIMPHKSTRRNFFY